MIFRKVFSLMFFMLLIIVPVKADNSSSIIPDIISPATPANVVGNGYEKHVDVDWYNNSEPDLAGYKVYRKVSGQFVFYTNVPKEKSYISFNIGVTGVTNEFKVSAYDLSGNESPLSDSVVTTTHDMTDEQFLDMVQRTTFRYFWDYAHPVSGLTRERLGSGETVTIGGSGFGVMALLVGIERGYVSREQGVERMLTILNFLNTKLGFWELDIDYYLDFGVWDLVFTTSLN